ncbi:MAG: radical SAM protein [Candidatus Aminicenantes bacterium]|nr:radical SAM protein [Candidatus Aminicenantes bacterium]
MIAPRALPDSPRFVYGPVPSRRLGYSLGIDLLPHKNCSFDCVYCQVGRTTQKTVRRRDFFPVADILAQVREALRAGKTIDCVTLSGTGEPTLYRSLGTLIREIKKASGLPVAVLTNGSLLYRKAVRSGLAEADIVIPTLDAADQAVLARVNRPHASLHFDRILRGLHAFRREFPGRIWLEVMLIKGMNDHPAHLRRLRPLIEALSPDRVQINTVVRPPAEKYARPLSRTALERARALLGGDSEIIADFNPLHGIPRTLIRGGIANSPLRGQAAVSQYSRSRINGSMGALQRLQRVDPTDVSPWSFRKLGRSHASALRGEDVLAVLKRRPVTPKDLALALGRPAHEVQAHLAALVRKGRARPVSHKGRRYFEAR